MGTLVSCAAAPFNDFIYVVYGAGGAEILVKKSIDNPRKLLYSDVSVVVIADANAVGPDIDLQMRKLISDQHLATSDLPKDRMV